ncbi:MAG: 2-succinyl-5-enolpyruvyl-6-hydroxy-3-cyclohexene-carboxylate synthase [Actinomycetota bacterium]|nr:2-succinyl-5-enolpyruvyl-6-hydroxy-3-cyclohexene-carboxylate synthase [Actinomycetota bacterium]
MSGVDVTTSFARTLVDEWVRNGITAAVVAPGSRNTPLTLALVRDGRVRVDVVLDERSAGFRGLGIGLASGRPAIVCCTSGTAAVNFHPAVVEARHARVPLLVCTADRPPELRDWGAGQTIDQAGLFGGAVRWFHDPGAPEVAGTASETNGRWRALAARAAAETQGPPAGPVHLNLPFREPLVPSGAPLLEAPGRVGGAPWIRSTMPRLDPDPADVARLTALVRDTPNGLLVAGWGAGVEPSVAEAFARAAGWPVIADPLSQLRNGSHAISTYEGLLRVESFVGAHRPELVVRIGAPVTSKVANAAFDGVPTVLVDPDAAWLDPQHTASERVRANGNTLLAAVTTGLVGDRSPAPWAHEWIDTEQRARRALDAVLDESVACEGRIARDVSEAVPDGSALVVASSLPVRALEWSMAPRAGVRVLANRGANGIDGFVSTVAGVAGAHGGPVVALCGDLCFLHDTNGLLDGGLLGGGLLDAKGRAPATFVVVDNSGGGIFAYLPQHDLPEFEPLFATPQSVDLVAVARAHGVRADRVDFSTLPGLLREETAATRVLVVPVDRAVAQRQHARAWEAVATAVA